MNIRTASLVAALAQILWSLLILVPQAFGFVRMPNFDWDRGLGLCESLALAVFFIVVYWEQKWMNSSSKMRYAALVAAFCLSIENLFLTYGTVRGVVLSSRDLLSWKYHPFIQARHVLAPTIPTLAVVTFVIFLILVWRTSPRLGDVARSPGNIGRGRTAVGVAAVLAFVVCIIALGQLLFLVRAESLWQRQGFASTFSLRLLSLGSLASFFLLMTSAQRNVSTPD